MICRLHGAISGSGGTREGKAPHNRSEGGTFCKLLYPAKGVDIRGHRIEVRHGMLVPSELAFSGSANAHAQSSQC